MTDLVAKVSTWRKENIESVEGLAAFKLANQQAHMVVALGCFDADEKARDSAKVSNIVTPKWVVGGAAALWSSYFWWSDILGYLVELVSFEVMDYKEATLRDLMVLSPISKASHAVCRPPLVFMKRKAEKLVEALFGHEEGR